MKLTAKLLSLLLALAMLMGMTAGLAESDAVELNMAFEDAFGYSIPDEELSKIKTVADIVSLLESQAK